MHRCLQKPAEGIAYPSAVVTGSCEPPDLCAGDGAPVSRRSNRTLRAEPAGCCVFGILGMELRSPSGVCIKYLVLCIILQAWTVIWILKWDTEMMKTLFNSISPFPSLLS